MNIKDFEQRRDSETGSAPPTLSLSENWLYSTKPKPLQKDLLHSIYDASGDAPDWFQLNSSKLVKAADITKAPGFDGTISLLSRISGWVTVTPKTKNRAKRLGRYGPFGKSTKGQTLREVSDLAPDWMQSQVAKTKEQ